VDTAQITLAVDRSLFGPQGRNWIERKVPELTSSLIKILITCFGTCMLVVGVCYDYYKSDFSGAITKLFMHLANGVVLFIIIKVAHLQLDHIVESSVSREANTKSKFSQWAMAAAQKVNDKEKKLWNWGQSRRNELTQSFMSDECSSDKSSLGETDDESSSILFERKKSGDSQDKNVCGFANEDKPAEASAISSLFSGKKSPESGRRLHSMKQLFEMFTFTQKTEHKLLSNSFFIRLANDESWMIVEDRKFKIKDGAGMGWLQSLVFKGYNIGTRYSGDISPTDAHRMLFRCELGRGSDYIRLRSCCTNTFLFMIGMQRPALVAWMRDVYGGDNEDFQIEWLEGGDGEGKQVILKPRKHGGYLFWGGRSFGLTSNQEMATKFILQGIR